MCSNLNNKTCLGYILHYFIFMVNKGVKENVYNVFRKISLGYILLFLLI